MHCVCFHRNTLAHAPLADSSSSKDVAVWIVLPPAAELLRYWDVGIGKQHARVRSSSRLINISCRIGDGCMYMSWLDAGYFWPLLHAVELLPGESCVARLQASSFVY
jgi:hypothetical protein